MLERPPLESFVGARINTYLVEQLIEQSELGALYSARESLNGSQYTLAVLSMSLAAPLAGVTALSTALDTFTHQASAIASLQHPYILPLVDYGSVGDMPYLAWPSVPTRPLSSRLAQGATLDLLTVGRYLDQIAAALEYAHEHLVLHRSLTIDSLSLQRDGRILVSDFGVRRMLEQGRKDAEWYALRNWNEACAPEQILGLAASPATDVYALGIILYQLLTGEPPYSGARRKDIMQQHLQAPFPSLKSRRPDLSGELDNLLSAATAKQAPNRFSQPGALANAYYEIVSPQQAGRVPFKLTTGTIVNIAASNNGAGGGINATLPPSTGTKSTLPPSLRSTLASPTSLDQQELQPGRPRNERSLPLANPAPRSSPLRIILIAGVLVALILGSVLAVSRIGSIFSVAPSGQATFMDSGPQALGQTNALTIQVTGLAAPATGHSYHAWIINQKIERVLPLGQLSQHGQTYTLSYQSLGPSAAAPGTNLLTLGTLLEITLEQGNPLLPTGRVVMSGMFPAQAFIHIGHLLVTFPTTPGKIGLLVGAQSQTYLLEIQAQALKSSAQAHDTSAIQCETESILDIIQGTAGPQYRPLTSACIQHGGATGDGFGLLGVVKPPDKTPDGYLANASDHAILATTQPDATANLRTHAHNVVFAITNVEGWVTTIQKDALLLETNPSSQPEASAIVTLANQAWQGVDRNGDHHIDPVPGEAGMVTAYSEGQQMATLALVSQT